MLKHITSSFLKNHVIFIRTFLEYNLLGGTHRIKFALKKMS